ncbi:ribosomal protein L30, ferredoxin-like fold domain-containing protein [Radiomyces spectabilis]|uniref:ribosomal protein L30, ferredoxin-like fold domain-containing protein n=1 Tax=Radiomyces spectabilis TaxID=64574 RepID=UPI00221F9BE8|nr:ribosomal protein L30, ferredoxin-like fold domain-containing protein [Radiomyces spectabilis]KAI8374623.1 ribosomal protein L30, ferredoxin-like fold domain-containing protein [Radiomyces spectabilis]
MADNLTIPNPSYVPETLLKKRKINEKKAIETARERAELRKAQKKVNRKTQFKRADEFVREFRAKQNMGNKIRKRVKNNQRSGLETSDSKLLFVVRIKGDSKVHPKMTHALKKLGLLHINNGVFVRLNKDTKKLIDIAEPYVAYGVPSLKTVRDLVVKRGTARIEGKRVPISDNAMVEEHLGAKGIICVEDIIHEIVTLGENFDTVNAFIGSFRLSNPVKGWRQKRLQQLTDKAEGVESIESDINKLVEAMN